jgi:peroxiredoxin
MRSLFIGILFFFAVPQFPMAGNTIRGEIRNTAGKKLFFYSVYGERTTLRDSAVADPAGNVIFPIPAGTLPGLYRISLTKDNYLNLILNHEDVRFVTSGESLSDSVRILASRENQAYYYYRHLDRMSQAKLEILVPVLDYYPEKDAFYSSVAAEFESIQKRQAKVVDSLAGLLPDSYAVRIFRLQQAPFIPASMSKDERMNWLKIHFLDQVNFKDTLLLNSDAWVNKAVSFLSLYSNNRLSQKQLEAEFIKAVTVILSAASVNADVYKFLLDYFVGGFDKYHFDNVITYIADNFQDPFSCEDQARKTTLQKKLENFKKIAVGKTAPDIEVPDMKGKPVKLSSISSEYTLLIFWSSECGHCVQMMPRVKQIYDKQKPKRMEIMTVSLDTSKTAWTKFIREEKLDWLNTSELKGFNSVSTDVYNIYATPTMFLLDREKKIIAKPVSYRELEDALRENKLLNQ